MRTVRASWQPDALCAALLYGCAALVFPLHLGWTGASWGGFAAYLGAAAVLYWAGDALARPRINALAPLPQSLLVVLAIGIPAVLAFAAGSLAGPAEEALDEQTCRAIGASEMDSAAAERNDTFDLTADCAVAGA